MMNRLAKGFLLFFISAGVFTACKKNDQPGIGTPINQQEFKHIRLLVSDAVAKTITQITPVDGSSSTFEAAFSNATLHATYNRRFGALLYGAENSVQFFDCGLEYHGDHVDVKGTPKFAAITANGLKPTHFKSRHEETLIFNDGDGTLSVADESSFHTSGATMRTINAGLDPHHGAMAQFDNGTYAVTVKDNASELSGPHAVKIINGNGEEVHAATIAVSRIHGNATDGKNAVFGVAGGVLVVKQDGSQRIINSPAGFGDIRLGTILEAPGVGKFIGFVATKGAYFVDIVNDVITPIAERTDVIQCKVDYDGNNLVLLTLDGNLKLYDLATGSLKKEAKLIPAANTADTFKPVLEATSKFIYVAVPSAGEVYQVSANDFTVKAKTKVTAQPSRLIILGHQSDESH